MIGYISRVILDPEATPADIAASAAGDSYGEHQRLWSLFSDRPDRQRDFLYRRETGRWPTYLVVSAREPGGTAAWRVETKPYRPRLVSGQRLRFVLRANPVIRSRDDDGRQHRHDVVMRAKRAARENGTPPGEEELLREAAVPWLAQRGPRHGFDVNEREVVVDSYHQHQIPRRGGRSIRFSTVDYEGILTVGDPERLLRSLGEGIGPSKAFGCGLLLVRPA